MPVIWKATGFPAAVGVAPTNAVTHYTVDKRVREGYIRGVQLSITSLCRTLVAQEKPDKCGIGLCAG
jgi:hypothetical protein